MKTVTLRFWGAKRDQPLTVTMRLTEPQHCIDHHAGVWIRGDIVDGDGVFGVGPASLFVPFRQLLWMIERTEATS